MTQFGCMQAAGYFGVWTAASAWYIAFAELLNETWFRGRVSLLLFEFASGLPCNDMYIAAWTGKTLEPTAATQVLLV